MDPLSFSTEPIEIGDQRRAWSEWFEPVFDVHSEQTGEAGFKGEYLVWKLGEASFTWASAPATRSIRTSKHVRHSPIDHWVISFCRSGPTAVSTKGVDLNAPAGAPFVWSLGYASDSRRTAADRLQLYLPRDSFSEASVCLDMVVGSMLDTGGGRMLAHYMLMLERNLPKLASEDAARLPAAIEAMVAACLAPSPDRVANASHQIKLTLMERVRQTVRRNLRSPSLGPDKLCREAAISRSQLYRMLEREGGVAKYIRTRRLSEGFVLLCDVSNTMAVGKIAEVLCFADASTFSRAFRREFGVSPSDVRGAAHAGLVPPAKLGKAMEPGKRSFSDWLCG